MAMKDIRFNNIKDNFPLHGTYLLRVKAEINK